MSNEWSDPEKVSEQTFTWKRKCSVTGREQVVSAKTYKDIENEGKDSKRGPKPYPAFPDEHTVRQDL